MGPLALINQEVTSVLVLTVGWAYIALKVKRIVPKVGLTFVDMVPVFLSLIPLATSVFVTR